MFKFKLKPETWRWVLSWFLVLDGSILLLASLTVFLPVGWMASTHQWLGLGEFPQTPISLYLARSTSMLYAVHGAIVLAVGRRLGELYRLVPLLALLHFLMGCLLFGIDWTSGMPSYWVWGEGPPIAGSGLVLGWMARNAELGSTNDA